MKATIALEYIGESSDARIALFSRIIDQVEPGLGHAVTGNTRPRKPWVAEIVGTDAKFGFKRSFLRSNWQRKDANASHSRGVMLWFVLESGRVYEVSAPVSWRNRDRYFCRVTQCGEILRLSETEATEWARNCSTLTS